MTQLESFCIHNGINGAVLQELCRKQGISFDSIIVVNQYYDYMGNTPEANRKYINSMNKYIKSNQNIYMPKYCVFFHSTGKILQNKILSEGLLPTSATRRRSYQSTDGYVYLASTIEKAEMFGRMGNGNNICTFAVLLKTTDLSVDNDQLRNMQVAYPNIDIKQTLGDSIVYGGGIRHKGRIEPYQIALVR